MCASFFQTDNSQVCSVCDGKQRVSAPLNCFENCSLQFLSLKLWEDDKAAVCVWVGEREMAFVTEA